MTLEYFMRESAGTLVFNAFPTGACEVGRTLPLVVRLVSIMSRTPYVMVVMGGPFVALGPSSAAPGALASGPARTDHVIDYVVNPYSHRRLPTPASLKLAM
jgi:hypothetical protein